MDFDMYDGNDLINILTGGQQQPHYEVVVGCNIKTGCDILFDIALSRLQSSKCGKTLEDAKAIVYSIHDETASVALGEYYPPDDLSDAGIEKLAELVLFLHSHIGERPPHRVSKDEVDQYYEKADALLDMRADVKAVRDSLQEQFAMYEEDQQGVIEHESSPTR